MNGAAEIVPLTDTITPASQTAVADAVRNAGNSGAAVYPIGGGTRLDYGVKPARPGIGLSLAMLNRVIDYPADDLTITVEAGITIGELNRCLAAQRQRLPVDVLQPDRATVGGAVALNAAGPRRYGYGTMRDYLLGFTAVDGTGMTFSGGGRVVKNAAGYNMCRLMAGSLGTLGVITQLTLMVRPLAEASALLACDLPDFALAERLLAGLVRSPARPVAIQLLAGRNNDHPPALGPVRERSVARLCAGFEGSTAEVDWMAGQLRAEWAAAGIADPMLAHNAAAEQFWQWLADFPIDVQISVLPGNTTGTVDQVLKLLPRCAIQAHAGDGIIGIRLPSPLVDDLGKGGVEGATAGLSSSADGTVGQANRGTHALSDSRLVGQLRAIAVAHGGTMTVLKRPDGVELTAADLWGPPGPEIRIMRAIKERFDPRNILNPGRFVY